MPIFEFTCQRCGHDFETLMRPGEPAPRCPSCQSADLERQLSLFAAKSDDRSRAAFKAAKKKATKAARGKQHEELAQAQREHDEHSH